MPSRELGRDELHALLSSAAAGHGRPEVRALIRASGTPLYCSDPQHPGLVVQVMPDGTRRMGRIEHRRFVEDTSALP